MPDNITLNTGVGGQTVATDEINGLHYQKVKLAHGSDDSATDVSTSEPLPALLYDPNMGGTRPHISHFGALKTSPVHPVLKGNFPGSSLNETIWNANSGTGGNIQVHSGVARLWTGAGNGTMTIRSRDTGEFEAGQVSVFQAGVWAGTGIPGNDKIWGLMTPDQQNGLYFKWQDGVFGVAARHNGNETFVPSGSFNQGNTFTPSNANNTYRIHYSAGRAIFQRAQQGNTVALHVMTDSQVPLVADLDMAVYFENTNTGTSFDNEMRIRGASASIFGELPTVRASGNLDDTFIMQPVKAIIVGKSEDGTYRNVTTTDGGAQLTASFEKEVTRGVVPKYSAKNKFGRNSDVDPGTPEDVWEGGGTYTGFPTGNAEIVRVSSSDANDTFNGPGAKSIYLEGLNHNWLIAGESVNLSGTTPVITTGVYHRVNRAFVQNAGISEGNEGIITIQHNVTTANIFAAIPVGQNQTTVAAYTVPSGKTAMLESLFITMSRANGTAGSADISLRARKPGEVFRAVRFYTATDSVPIHPPLQLGQIFTEMTDIKIRVESVSDTNTAVTADMEFILRDNN